METIFIPSKKGTYGMVSDKIARRITSIRGNLGDLNIKKVRNLSENAIKTWEMREKIHFSKIGDLRDEIRNFQIHKVEEIFIDYICPHCSDDVIRESSSIFSKHLSIFVEKAN